MHLLLSWREDENPTREQVGEAVNITLDEMNLSECQAVHALHQNTDNMHLHICVNRDENGKPQTRKVSIGKIDAKTGNPVYKPEYLARVSGTNKQPDLSNEKLYSEIRGS
jgi:hypothetical protein